MAENSKIVRCISLWQPWASLMASGAKTIESRSWYTGIRGEVYIHAAKTYEGIRVAREMLTKSELLLMETHLECSVDKWQSQLPLGALVAKGVLIACFPGLSVQIKHRDQLPFGDFSRGRFGHVYDCLESITPIPCRGKQGFFFAEVEQ